MAMLGPGFGVTAMDTSVARVTVSAVEPEMFPEAAVMVVVPIATGVTFPLEPDALLIVATDVADELHVTVDVISCVLPSEKVSVALNCRDIPTGMPMFAGVMAIDTGVAGLTVRVEEPEILPEAAVMVAVPTAAEEAFP